MHLELRHLRTVRAIHEQGGLARAAEVLNHDDSEFGASAEMHDGVFVRSIYFRDPDDIQLEFAAWTKVFDESDVRHAPAKPAVATPA